jgi:superfamily II DNA or RNA helicase
MTKPAGKPASTAPKKRIKIVPSPSAEWTLPSRPARKKLSNNEQVIWYCLETLHAKGYGAALPLREVVRKAYGFADAQKWAFGNLMGDFLWPLLFKPAIDQGFDREIGPLFLLLFQKHFFSHIELVYELLKHLGRLGDRQNLDDVFAAVEADLAQNLTEVTEPHLIASVKRMQREVTDLYNKIRRGMPQKPVPVVPRPFKHIGPTPRHTSAPMGSTSASTVGSTAANGPARSTASTGIPGAKTPTAGAPPTAAAPSPTSSPSSEILTVPEEFRRVQLDFQHLIGTGEAVSLFGDEGLKAVEMVLAAQQVHLLKEFDELLCEQATIGVIPHRYQWETVRTVITRFHGRAILADEVGLGKTIEAGMVIKEYLLRNLARRVLVLVPPALVGQWHGEMSDKFLLSFVTTADPLFKENPDQFWASPLIIASLGLVRTARHFDECLRHEFDLVVVDEAHHLKNAASKGHQLVEQLKRKFLLLLTATPIQNNLLEIYHLINLLRPGTLGTTTDFKKRFVNPENPAEPLDRDGLRTLLRTAMVRNTRSFVDIKLPRRFASTRKIVPTPPEAEIIAALTQTLRECFQATQVAPSGRLHLANLLNLAGSSLAAVGQAVARNAALLKASAEYPRLKQLLKAIPESGKDQVLLELIRKAPDKSLVFTRFTDTLEHLRALLTRHAIPHAVFHGQMSGSERDRAVEAFRDAVPVLLATETGGEGRNLQFCNTLINYDLPWNPMRIEQRIGRLHRIGQTRDVFIFNLCLTGSVEERMLEILEEKINLFELVVGEIDMILGHLKGGETLEDLIVEIWLGQSDEAARTEAFADLGRKLGKARRVHETIREFDESLFKDDFEA